MKALCVGHKCQRAWESGSDAKDTWQNTRMWQPGMRRVSSYTSSQYNKAAVAWSLKLQGCWLIMWNEKFGKEREGSFQAHLSVKLPWINKGQSEIAIGMICGTINHPVRFLWFFMKCKNYLEAFHKTSKYTLMGKVQCLQESPNKLSVTAGYVP